MVLKISRNGAGQSTRIYHVAYAPDIRKAYFFFWGCNLSCRGCLCKKEINCLALEENLDAVFRDPLLRPPQSPGQFLALKGLVQLLDGIALDEVAFEGQEATVDPSLPDICRWLKERKCRVVLHTNGVRLADVSHIDDVIVSLKAVTPALYQEYTSLSNQFVLGNFNYYYQAGVNLKAESVFIPGYIGLDEIERIASFIAGVDRKIPYRIDAYFESGDNPWRPPSAEELKEAVGVARRHLDNVYSTQQTKRDLKKEDLSYQVQRLY